MPLGMPKPYVHLVRTPLDVVLEARQVGNDRASCAEWYRPNAVLQPVLFLVAGGKENVKEKETKWPR